MEVVDIYDSDSFSEDSFDGDLEYEGGSRTPPSPKQKKEFPPPEHISPKHKETLTVVKAEDIEPPMSSTSLPIRVPTEVTTPCKPCAARTSETDDDDDDVSTEEDDDDSDDGAKSETSTIDALSKDPLFLVLSEYLSNDQGNIVDALFKINKSLKKMIKLMKKK